MPQSQAWDSTESQGCRSQLVPSKGFIDEGPRPCKGTCVAELWACLSSLPDGDLPP